MKTLITISSLILLYSTSIFSQKFEFKGYGMELPNYSSGIEYTNGKLIIEKLKDDSFSIIAYDPSDNSIAMKAVVVYGTSDKNDYVYKGNIIYLGKFEVCLIITKINLLNFTKGVGNPNKEYYKNDYSIRIFHDENPQSYLDLKRQTVIYPVNLK
jgi:hypothetical protein